MPSKYEFETPEDRQSKASRQPEEKETEGLVLPELPDELEKYRSKYPHLPESYTELLQRNEESNERITDILRDFQGAYGGTGDVEYKNVINLSSIGDEEYTNNLRRNINTNLRTRFLTTGFWSVEMQAKYFQYAQKWGESWIHFDEYGEPRWEPTEESPQRKIYGENQVARVFWRVDYNYTGSPGNLWSFSMPYLDLSDQPVVDSNVFKSGGNGAIYRSTENDPNYYNIYRLKLVLNRFFPNPNDPEPNRYYIETPRDDRGNIAGSRPGRYEDNMS